MNLSVKIAQFPFIDEIIEFFKKNLEVDNDAIYNEEFFCEFGIKKAIREKYIVIATIGNKIIGAARFYPRKNDNVISLYQFAVDERYRNICVMDSILGFLPGNPVESLCPINSEFNDYYRKKGWELYRRNDKYFIWRFNKSELLLKE